jgi:hypothetical protein
MPYGDVDVEMEAVRASARTVVYPISCGHFAACSLSTWFLCLFSLVPPAADRVDRERKPAVMGGCQKNQRKP